MLTASAVVLAVGMTTLAGHREGPLLARGGDPARGILVNHTPGSRPFDLPDPNRPSLIFIHGINPLPGVVHFVMADRVSEAMALRGGPASNVLAWDWNAATVETPSHRENLELRVGQGQALAYALIRAGLDPARTHLIGHSAGGLVATSAAHVFARQFGRPAAQLTLLDPASCYHSLLFERLQAGTLCPIVENYWSPGPSAYGKEISSPGVRNIQIPAKAYYRGVICPLRSDHFAVFRWYLATMEQRGGQFGFNNSTIFQ